MLNEKINIKIRKPEKLLLLKAFRQDFGLFLLKIFTWYAREIMKGNNINKAISGFNKE